MILPLTPTTTAIPDMDHDDSSCSDTDTVLNTPTTMSGSRISWDLGSLGSRRSSSMKKKHKSLEWLVGKKAQQQNQHNQQNQQNQHPQQQRGDDDATRAQFQKTIDRMTDQIDEFLRQREQRLINLKRDTQKSDIPRESSDAVFHDLPTWWLDDPYRGSSGPGDVVVSDEKRTTRQAMALQRLAQRHAAAKKLWKRQMRQMRHQADDDRRAWQAKMRAQTSATQEAEETVECVREEMERMMDEINDLKQQLHEATNNTPTWPRSRDMNTTDTKNAQLDQLDQFDTSDAKTTTTTRDLEEKLALAEKRAAENELRVAVLQQRLKNQAKSDSDSDMNVILDDGGTTDDKDPVDEEFASSLKAIDHDSDQDSGNSMAETKNAADDAQLVIRALQQAIRDKDLELAQSRDRAEKQKRQWEQQRTVDKLTLAQEKATWRAHYEQELAKERDLCLLQATRNERALEISKAELEAEIDRLETLIAHHENQWSQLHLTCQRTEQQWIRQQRIFDQAEKEARSTIVALEQRIIGLETETVQLYGKNLQFANQLIEYDDVA